MYNISEFDLFIHFYNQKDSYLYTDKANQAKFNSFISPKVLFSYYHNDDNLNINQVIPDLYIIFERIGLFLILYNNKTENKI